MKFFSNQPLRFIIGWGLLVFLTLLHLMQLGELLFSSAGSNLQLLTRLGFEMKMQKWGLNIHSLLYICSTLFLCLSCYLTFRNKRASIFLKLFFLSQALGVYIHKLFSFQIKFGPQMDFFIELGHLFSTPSSLKADLTFNPFILESLFKFSWLSSSPHKFVISIGFFPLLMLFLLRKS